VVWPKRLGVVVEGWLLPNRDTCGFVPNIDDPLTVCQYGNTFFREYTCLENAMVNAMTEARCHVM
jgi:hypothetical protein